MEIRISRILSEYYDFTRREAEELIRAGRVKKNDEIVEIGDKASLEDTVRLDDVPVPLKGIFRKVQREKAKSENSRFGAFNDELEDDGLLNLSPKRSELRKGRKNFGKSKLKGKNSNAPSGKYKHRNKSFDKDGFGDF